MQCIWASWFVAAQLMAADANVIPTPTYALMVVEKAQTNHQLVSVLEDSIVRLGALQRLSVLALDPAGAGLTEHPELQVGACAGKLFCIADEVSKGGISHLLIARAMPSQVAPGGVVMQVLVLQTATHKVQRKADMEVAVAEDAPLAIRANFLGLFGQRWGAGRSRLTGLEEMAEDFKLRLAGLADDTPPTDTEVKQLDEVVTDMEAIMAQLQGELVDMNRRAFANWQREHPAGGAQARPATAAIQ